MINKELLDKNALPIKDDEIINFINKISTKIEMMDVLRNNELKDVFLNNYIKWVSQTSLNNIEGLNNFKYKSYIHGTIQGFDMFYSEFNSRTFRFFRGEFIYHKLCARNNYKFKYIDEIDINENDAVIVSLPFADSGDEHERMKILMEECERKKIPVLVDLAYINLAENLNVNLNYNCVHTVTLSLSKAFYSLDRLRVGMRLKKDFNDDPIDVFNSIGMVNLFGMHVGNKLINEFSPDFLCKKYKTKQHELCDELGIKPSKSVIFGIGNDEYKDYNRGGEFNRIGLSSLLSS